MPWYNALASDYPHLGLPEGTLNLLYVCSQLYEIGPSTFYGMYGFRTVSAESFRLLFTKHIGPSNLKSIRQLAIGLPHGVKTMPSKFIGRYTRMLDVQMPQLQEFTITAKFGRWYHPVTLNPFNTWIENHRGMLWFAAWVSRSHPLLKFAVWNEMSTVFRNRLDDSTWDHFDNRPDVEITLTISATRPKGLQKLSNPRIAGTLNAELDSLYGAPEPDEDGYHYIDAFDSETGLPIRPHSVVSATNLLLDTYKIRRTGFVSLSTREACRPYAYQLPINAKKLRSFATVC